MNFPVIFEDRFDYSISRQWSSISGDSRGVLCGFQGVAALRFSLGGPRVAVSPVFNSPDQTSVSFYFRLGSSLLTSECERPEPGDFVVLEASRSGDSWQELWRSVPVDQYLVARTVNVTVAADAARPQLQLRWRQVAHSGPLYDQWMMDTVAVRSMGSLIPRTVTPVIAPPLADQVLLSATFDHSPLRPLWSALSLATPSIRCGFQGTRALVFGQSTTANPSPPLPFRGAVSKAVNASGAGTLSFYFRLGADSGSGSGSGGGGCEAVEAHEFVVVEVRRSVQPFWTQIWTSADVPRFTTPQTIKSHIPGDPSDPWLQFRWRQLSHSGPGFDMWMLDTVTFAQDGGLAFPPSPAPAPAPAPAPSPSPSTTGGGGGGGSGIPSTLLLSDNFPPSPSSFPNPSLWSSALAATRGTACGYNDTAAAAPAAAPSAALFALAGPRSITSVELYAPVPGTLSFFLHLGSDSGGGSGSGCAAVNASVAVLLQLSRNGQPWHTLWSSADATATAFGHTPAQYTVTVPPSSARPHLQLRWVQTLAALPTASPLPPFSAGEQQWALDAVTFTVQGHGRLPVAPSHTQLFDSFNSAPLPPLTASPWLSRHGASLSSACGAQGASALTFTSGYSRALVSKLVNASQPGRLSFFFALGNSVACPTTCDGCFVVLETRRQRQPTASGAQPQPQQWTEVWTSFNRPMFIHPSTVTVPIAGSASSPLLQFQWRQVSNHGSGTDAWMIDSVWFATQGAPRPGTPSPAPAPAPASSGPTAPAPSPPANLRPHKPLAPGGGGGGGGAAAAAVTTLAVLALAAAAAYYYFVHRGNGSGSGGGGRGLGGGRKKRPTMALARSESSMPWDSSRVENQRAASSASSTPTAANGKKSPRALPLVHSRGGSSGGAGAAAGAGAGDGGDSDGDSDGARQRSFTMASIATRGSPALSMVSAFDISRSNDAAVAAALANGEVGLGVPAVPLSDDGRGRGGGDSDSDHHGRRSDDDSCGSSASHGGDRYGSLDLQLDQFSSFDAHMLASSPVLSLRDVSGLSVATTSTLTTADGGRGGGGVSAAAAAASKDDEANHPLF